MRLLLGAVEVDLSTLTGESVPVLRSAEFQDADVPRLRAGPLALCSLRRKKQRGKPDAPAVHSVPSLVSDG